MLMNDFGLLGSESLTDPTRDKYGTLIDASVGEDLMPVLSAVRQRVNEIGKDGRLTTEGRIHEFRLTGARAHDKLEQLHSTRRRKLEQDAQQAKAPSRLPNEAEFAKENHLEPIHLHARMEAIRHVLRTLDPVERKTALTEAAQKGDVAVLLAASGFHPFVRPVRSSDLNSAIQEWIDASTPPEALAVREAMTQYDANYKTAQTHVGELTGVQASNSHARTAAKQFTRPPMFAEPKEADRDSRLP